MKKPIADLAMGFCLYSGTCAVHLWTFVQIYGRSAEFAVFQTEFSQKILALGHEPEQLAAFLSDFIRPVIF